MKISVPGVNKILGTFVYCSQGPAVCTLDNKQLVADIKERNDGIVRACLVKTGECKKLSPSSNKSKKDDKWFNAIKGVYCVFAQKYPSVKCLDIALDGNLLECEGRIVASAITLATIKALNQFMKLNLSNEDIVKLFALSLAAVSYEGNMSDVITMLYAKDNQIVVYDGLTGKFEIFDDPFTGSEYSMIVFDGHVPTSSVKEEALEVTGGLTKAFKIFYSKFGARKIDIKDPVFADFYYSLDEDTKRWSKYLYEEHKATQSISNIIKTKDISAIGKVLDKVRTSYNENLDMTCPEIEWALKRACENPGCIGGCIFFEGFCTKTVVIVKNTYIPRLLEYIVEYQHIFGFDVTTQFFGDYK